MNETQEPSDENLMVRLAKGDHQAFCALVRRHTERFYACAYRICLHQDDAEDAVQNAFLKLWNNPSIWQEGRGAKFTTWFYRVVSNSAIDIVRKRKNNAGPDVLDYMPSDADNQEASIQKSQEQQALEQAIYNLPDRQKDALNLCFYDGFSNKEAAEILGVGVKALESLLMRAKKSLKENLMQQGLIEKEQQYGS